MPDPFNRKPGSSEVLNSECASREAGNHEAENHEIDDANAGLFDKARVDALFEVLGETAGRHLLAHFAEELPRETRAIAAEVIGGRIAEAGRHAHSLKGAAANFGAARLQAALRELELAARTLTTPRALEGLLTELDRVARGTSLAARTI